MCGHQGSGGGAVCRSSRASQNRLFNGKEGRPSWVVPPVYHFAKVVPKKLLYPVQESSGLLKEIAFALLIRSSALASSDESVMPSLFSNAICVSS